MSDLPEELLERYEPLRPLGGGAFGTVHLARDRSLERLVALKLLRAGIDDEETRKRFLREARLTSGLEHPNIVEVYDHGLLREGTAYIAYEYVAGEDLASRRAASPGGVDPQQVLAWGSALADALQVAHDAGVVHRDVKPENVLVDPEERPVLCDFGVARPESSKTVQTAEGLVLGTPSFLAPELWRGDAPSPASDQYALAATLFELLYDERVHPGDTVEEILAQHDRGGEVSLPRAPRGDLQAAEAALSKALRRDPARRFESMRAFSAALLGAEGAPRVTPVQGIRARSSRTRPFLIGAAGLGVVVAGLAATGLPSRPAPPPPRPTEVADPHADHVRERRARLDSRFADFSASHRRADGSLEWNIHPSELDEHIVPRLDWITDPRFPVLWSGLARSLWDWLDAEAARRGLPVTSPDLLEDPALAETATRIGLIFLPHVAEDLSRIESRITQSGMVFSSKRVHPALLDTGVVEQLRRASRELLAETGELLGRAPVAAIPTPLLPALAVAHAHFSGDRVPELTRELEERALALPPGDRKLGYLLETVRLLGRGVRRLGFECASVRASMNRIQEVLEVERLRSRRGPWVGAFKRLTEERAGLLRDCADQVSPEDVEWFREALTRVEGFLADAPRAAYTCTRECLAVLQDRGTEMGFAIAVPPETMERLRDLHRRAREAMGEEPGADG